MCKILKIQKPSATLQVLAQLRTRSADSIAIPDGGTSFPLCYTGETSALWEIPLLTSFCLFLNFEALAINGLCVCKAWYPPSGLRWPSFFCWLVVCVFLSHICHTFGKDSAYFGFEKFAKAEDGPSEKDGAAAGQELSAVHKWKQFTRFRINLTLLLQNLWKAFLVVWTCAVLTLSVIRRTGERGPRGPQGLSAGIA